jgi:hypothetical protein
VGFAATRRHGCDHRRRRNMTAYYSTVLDHPLETVWSLIPSDRKDIRLSSIGAQGSGRTLAF